MHAVPLDQLVIQTVNGIVTGMILALVASGLTLIFGIMDVVNFAHGELFMLGAYVGVLILAATGNFWLALVAASLLIALLGAVIYLTTLRPLLGRDPLTTILATFGRVAGIAELRAVAVRPGGAQDPGAVHRPVHLVLPATTPGTGWSLPGCRRRSSRPCGCSSNSARYGIWIRATTQDRVMAEAMGIPVPWVLTGVFAIGSAMAAASGVLFGPLVGVNHAMGLDWVLKAFIVVVVGGMGNLGGSILAAIFISLLEAYASLWVSPAQAIIVSFVVLILTLLFRPTGLFVPTPK